MRDSDNKKSESKKLHKRLSVSEVMKNEQNSLDTTKYFKTILKKFIRK